MAGYSNRERITAACFYGASSFLIMFVNKWVLTVYNFPAPQFLAMAQFVGTIVALTIMKATGKIHFADLSVKNLTKVFPLPLIFLFNTVSGLGGTKKISLPMFTVLRRLTMLFTIIAERYLLGTRHSRKIQFCVAVMIGGAAVAAVDDLAFDMVGYLFILANDLFSTANGIVLKKKLDAKDLGKWGLMYYNSLISLPMLVLFLSVMQPSSFTKVAEFDGWSQPGFVLYFLISSFMGFVLNYATFLCTEVNSPLTTAVVGALKNVVVTYSGMVIGGDYIFSWANFLGINMSMVGSLWYARVTFTEKLSKGASKPPRAADEENGRRESDASPVEDGGEEEERSQLLGGDARGARR